MSKSLLFALVLILLVGIGGFFILQNSNKSVAPASDNSSAVPVKKEGFLGNVLAGEASPYLDFTKADYDKALASGKVVFLNFYADWCPICRAEEPDIFAGFNELVGDQVIGFRVNFNDPQTDDQEKALAQEFGIPYQHTKVILKNGKETLKETAQWSKDELLQQLTKATQ